MKLMLDFGICSSLCFFLVKITDITAKQCDAINYCVRYGKTGIETLSELKEAFGDECLAKLAVLKLVLSIFFFFLDRSSIKSEPQQSIFLIFGIFDHV